MAEKLNKDQTVTLEELVMSQILEMQALYNFLEKKGVMTKNELLEEIKRLKQVNHKTD